MSVSVRIWAILVVKYWFFNNIHLQLVQGERLSCMSTSEPPETLIDESHYKELGYARDVVVTLAISFHKKLKLKKETKSCKELANIITSSYWSYIRSGGKKWVKKKRADNPKEHAKIIMKALQVIKQFNEEYSTNNLTIPVQGLLLKQIETASKRLTDSRAVDENSELIKAMKTMKEKFCQGYIKEQEEERKRKEAEAKQKQLEEENRRKKLEEEAEKRKLVEEIEKKQKQLEEEEWKAEAAAEEASRLRLEKEEEENSRIAALRNLEDEAVNMERELSEEGKKVLEKNQQQLQDQVRQRQRERADLEQQLAAEKKEREQLLEAQERESQEKMKSLKRELKEMQDQLDQKSGAKEIEIDDGSEHVSSQTYENDPQDED